MFSISELLVAEATNVKLYVSSTWHLKNTSSLYVAATVKYHGARPWHRFDFLHTHGSEGMVQILSTTGRAKRVYALANDLEL
jgi:hypothetical protein